MMRKKEIIGIMTILFFVFYIGYSIYERVYLPRLTLRGKNVIILNYKEKYHDPGVEASYQNQDVTNLVKITGKVNEHKLGFYKIKYSLDIKGKRKEITRDVFVKDIESPKISLLDNRDIYTCEGNYYHDIVDYQVVDNYDKNLKDKVKITKRSDAIIYEVKDSAGNTAKLEKKIHYKDIESPKLSLNQESDIYLLVGDEYQEDGYKVVDNCDKEVDKKVKIKKNIDKSTPGIYKITYQVEDKKKNKTVKIRRIHMVKKDMPGTVYLTFDDGPKEGTTDIILDILKKKKIKATFFVTSSGPDSLIKREYDEGHTIGLHTSSHNYSYIYSSKENYFEDLQKIHDRVFLLTGVDSKIIRFPGGSSNTISRRYKKNIMSELTQEVVNRGYKYYDWNILSGDAGDTIDPNEIVNHVVGNLRQDRVNIVLMHDIKPYTRDALERIIDYGKEHGFFFDKIDENSRMLIQRVMN